MLTDTSLYQGMQAKALTDRYSKLKGQMDSIIREANEEMSMLRENLNSMFLFIIELGLAANQLFQTRSRKAPSSSTETRIFRGHLHKRAKTTPSYRSSSIEHAVVGKGSTSNKQQRVQSTAPSSNQQLHLDMLTTSEM